jgi:hypothetical protein
MHVLYFFYSHHKIYPFTMKFALKCMDGSKWGHRRALDLVVNFVRSFTTVWLNCHWSTVSRSTTAAKVSKSNMRRRLHALL